MRIRLSVFAVLLLAAPLAAQVPNLIPQQGRVAVNDVNFDGTGQFKFALVYPSGTSTGTAWSNDGSSVGGSQPATAVSLPVTKGLYSVMLGDTSVDNMTALPSYVFGFPDLRVRVWFNNGTVGFQQLTPDRRLAPNGYLPDGVVTGAKIADGAVTSAKIAAGAVTSSILAPGVMPAAVPVTGTSQTAAANTSYIATSSGNTVFTLPEPGPIGSVIDIRGAGAGGVQVFDPASTQIWIPRSVETNWISVACSADGVRRVAVALGLGNGGIMVTSADAGETWTTRGTLRKWRGVASSSDGMKLVAVVQDGMIYTSTDAGVTWTPRNGNAYWNAVASSADGTRLFAASLGGITTSPDSGVSWSPALAGTGGRAWNSMAVSADGMKVVAVASGHPIYTSADFGATWTPRETARTWSGVASSADGVNLAAVADNGQIYTSTDSGVTWTPRDSIRNWAGIASSSDGTKLIASDYGGKLYVSRNAGVSWAPVESDRYWKALAISADGRQVTATVTDGRLYTNGSLVFTGGSGSRTMLISTPSGWKTVETAGWSMDPATGYAGIGTVEPAARIHAYGAENPAVLRLQSAAGPGYGRLEFVSDPQHSPNEWRPAYIQSTDAGGFTGGLKFVTNGTGAANRFAELEVMRIQNGAVGIGTATPGALLQLGDVGVSNSQGLMRYASTSPSRSAWRSWEIGVPGGTEDVTGRNYSFVIEDLQSNNGQPEFMVRYDTGLVGIGRVPAGNRLEVEGNASKTTAGSWLANSDRRIKTDITPVTGALATLEKVRPVTFRYTEEYRNAHPDIKDVPYYNVIAQEFREVFPDAVKPSGDKLPDGSEILQVDTYPATITAIAAIKELKAENEALKASNQALEKRLAALEAMMSRTQPVKFNPNKHKTTP